MVSCLPVRTVVEKLIVSGGLWLFFLFPHAHTHTRWHEKRTLDGIVKPSVRTKAGTWSQRPRIMSLWNQKCHHWLETSNSFFLQTSIVKIICLVEIPTHTQLFLLYAVFWANLSVQSSVYRLFDIFKPYVCCIPLFSYGLDIRIHAEKRERESGGGVSCFCNVGSTK